MIDVRLWKINWFDEISACLHLYLESTQPLIQEETHEQKNSFLNFLLRHNDAMI